MSDEFDDDMSALVRIFGLAEIAALQASPCRDLESILQRPWKPARAKTTTPRRQERDETAFEDLLRAHR